MQARVEPPFLFNTLAQVKRLYEMDATLAQRMLDDLVAYLRAAMPHMRDTSWESKYFYDRRRPSELDHKLPTALPVPNSPSYPSEHAATAQAAATVLAHFLPAEAQAFQSMAEQAG
jgi:hypothetical protein